MSKTEIRCNQCGKNWDGHESLMKWVIQGKQGGGLNNFCKEDCAEKFTNKMNKSQPEAEKVKTCDSDGCNRSSEYRYSTYCSICSAAWDTGYKNGKTIVRKEIMDLLRTDKNEQ